MIKISERLYVRVVHIYSIPTVLNEIEQEHVKIGHSVKRGILNSVILLFPDGEVHFTPCSTGIKETIFKY